MIDADSTVVKEGVSAIFPLTEAQQAWLLHSLRAGPTDMGFQHNTCTIKGPLDVEAFHASWQRVVDRHAALRTSFHWEGIDRALQVVHREARLTLVTEDWRGLSNDQHEERIQAFQREDRGTGFDFGNAPIMRLSLFRTDETTHRLVWSLHHLVMDGWSTSIVAREAFDYLDSPAALPADPEPRPYLDYIRWLQRQDPQQAETFWKEELAGYSIPRARDLEDTLAWLAGGTGAGPHDAVYAHQTLTLSDETTAAINAMARHHRVTLAVVVDAAWALLLARDLRRDEVVFGITVSGRPPELQGSESMVGLFINTVPLRVRLPRAAPIGAWVTELHARQVQATCHQHTPLLRIHACSELAPSARLFETVVVVENYPGDRRWSETRNGLEVTNFRGEITSTYPLTIIAFPSARLRLRARYDRRRLAENAVAEMLDDWRLVLGLFAAHPQWTIADVTDELGGARREPTLSALETPESALGAGVIGPTDVEERADEATEPRDVVAPRTSAEIRIAEVWRRVLEIPEISVHDNFFDLGGYSLTALKAAEQLEVELGITVKLPDLVFQTLGQFAAACEARGVEA